MKVVHPPGKAAIPDYPETMRLRELADRASEMISKEARLSTGPLRLKFMHKNSVSMVDDNYLGRLTTTMLAG